MPNYIIQFRTDQERLDLFNFFKENGFIFYRESGEFNRNELWNNLTKGEYGLKTYPYGLIDSTIGNLQILVRIWSEYESAKILNNEAPIKVFFDVVREFKACNKMLPSVSLKGKYVHEGDF